jgi:hypothetical protein
LVDERLGQLPSSSKPNYVSLIWCNCLTFTTSTVYGCKLRCYVVMQIQKLMQQHDRPSCNSRDTDLRK